MAHPGDAVYAALLQIDRLLDLRQNSRRDAIERALAALDMALRGAPNIIFRARETPFIFVRILVRRRLGR